MKNFTTFTGDDTDERDLDSTNSMKNENQQAWLNNAYSDIYVSRNYILGFGLCIAIVIGFLYSLLLQIQGVLMIIVWGSILLTIAMIIGVGYYANQEVQVWIDEEPKLKTDREIMALQICVYIIWAFGGILFCLMVALRKKIRLAIGIVKESAKCVAKMPALILFRKYPFKIRCIIQHLYLELTNSFKLLSCLYSRPPMSRIDVFCIRLASICSSSCFHWRNYNTRDSSK